MNFCYINLWSYENKISLLSGGSLVDQLQFLLVKRKTKFLVIKVLYHIHRKRELGFEVILSKLSFNRNDIWERLFIYTIINHIAFNAANGIKLSTENNVESVLAIFHSKITTDQSTIPEILNLKLEKIKLQSEMDLLQMTASNIAKS